MTQRGVRLEVLPRRGAAGHGRHLPVAELRHRLQGRLGLRGARQLPRRLPPPRRVLRRQDSPGGAGPGRRAQSVHGVGLREGRDLLRPKDAPHPAGHAGDVAGLGYAHELGLALDGHGCPLREQRDGLGDADTLPG
eukprot:scaffold2815_cov250-Pinguiococcus_pyrenoidosus.AAC.1